MSPIDELKAIWASMEYAYAMGHGCSMGYRPSSLQAVLDRETVLLEQLRKGSRVAHAVPDGSSVALCGRTPGSTPSTGDAVRCPDCELEAGRKNWTGRG